MSDAQQAAVPTTAPEEVRFTDLNLDSRLQKAIDKLGFEFCSPIQAESLPYGLKGGDVLGKAQTGTGKTAAFLIAIINNLLNTQEQEERYNGEPRALILAPTRELALQIEKDAKELIRYTPLTLMSVVGGIDYRKQQQRLNDEIIDIMVGTPGRLLDFIQRKELFLSEVEALVIDEADRMLDMGFIPDVKRIVNETPKTTHRQTLFFSATFSQDILNLVNRWTWKALTVEIEPESIAADSIDQKVFLVTTREKFTLLYNLITQQRLACVIVFANRRDEVRKLSEQLKKHGIRCGLLSGEIAQHKRIKTLENFRTGNLQVLVATDVAGRGIHIDGISHVVNYTLPDDPEDYVHRIGRTGRAGEKGISVSFACEKDSFQLPLIESLLKRKLDCAHPDDWLLKPPPSNR